MDPLTTTPTRPGSGVWFSRARDQLSQAVGRHNPFYLLSAACMLGGCLLLTNSLSWSPIKFHKLLALLLTLNVYEVLLLGLGLFLVAREGRRAPQTDPSAAGVGPTFRGSTGPRRDGAQLLLLSALFMADAAFLCSEVVSSNFHVGVVVSVGLFLLAMLKVHVASYVLRVRLDPGRSVAIGLMLASVFGLPCILKYIGDTHVHGPHLYVAWWAAALLWGAYHVVARPTLRTAAERSPVPFDALFVVIPFLSLLTHIGILHYVYNEPFVGPDAAPMLLTLSLILSRLPAPAHLETAKARRFLIGALPVLAVMVSIHSRIDLRLDFRGVGEIAPVVLASAGAYVVLAAAWLPRYFIRLLTCGAFASILYAIGPSAAEIAHLGSRAWAAVTWLGGAIGSLFSLIAFGIATFTDWCWSFLPETPVGWGITAVSSAFALLGLGATVSMRRPPIAGPVPEPLHVEST